MIGKRVCIDLSQDEAVVLHDWLFRFNKSKDHILEDQAEQRELWDIEAVLESKVDILFDPQYGELLKIARSKVRDA